MDRTRFLLTSGGLVAGAWVAPTTAAQSAPPPLEEPHFPDRLHQFVWRNWELANADRMAQVTQTHPEELVQIGNSMGLPPKPTLTEEQLRRIYVTIIRQNWHLLPNEQLRELLGWDRAKFEFTLKEDDFLDHKLGPKPDCRPVIYREPSPQARRRAEEIRRILEDKLGKELHADGEAPFHFVRKLSDSGFANVRDPGALPAAGQVDVSSWAIGGGEGVDPRITERLGAYLHEAMGTNPGSEKAGRIEFEIETNLGETAERFEVTVENSRVGVAAPQSRGLLQASYWLQDRMEEAGGPFLEKGNTKKQAVFDPRYLYSYFALYGDPLLEPGIDPFPDGYLEKLARVGMNGVWMQAVLSTLAPAQQFPEFGDRWDERLRTLQALVARAERYGLKLYLYINEPRARHGAFYNDREGMKGAAHGGLFAMCTAIPAVREWISDSLAHVFAEVPDLGGVFAITMSENLTNCFSKGTQDSCPRCRRRQVRQGVTEVVHAIRDGVRRSSAGAEVIIWDWGWAPWGRARGHLGREVIPKLPPGIRLMSVSEWDVPIERGGVKTKVGEYSISAVGPGPRALENWSLAKAAGIPAMAKTQFNNTWEISAVPYIPVPYLVARHCANLTRAGVSGLMASWTLGGYPSPNLQVAKEFYFAPAGSIDEILRRVAARRYGKEAASQALAAWKAFSDAFEEYPYGVHMYLIPTQHGPANRLRLEPTGVRPSMLLFPQDDYRTWARDYPPEVVRDQFAKMAEQWQRGISAFRRVVELAPSAKKDRAREDLAIAEVCQIHFHSVANQVEFYLLRDQADLAQRRQRMRALVRAELELARRLYPLARRHSLIAFEATNHYYYRPLDLAETIIHCQYMLDNGLPAASRDRRQ